MRVVSDHRPGPNLIMVTHGSTIQALTGINPNTAEMVILTPQRGQPFRSGWPPLSPLKRKRTEMVVNMADIYSIIEWISRRCQRLERGGEGGLRDIERRDPSELAAILHVLERPGAVHRGAVVPDHEVAQRQT